MKSLDVSVSNRIDGVDIKKWDSLADFAFLKSDFLRIAETLTLGKDVYYVQILDKRKLAGIAVFYGQKRCLYDSLSKSIYGNYSKIVNPILGLDPALLCCCIYSPFYEAFRVAEGYDKSEVFCIISDELKRIANKDGYKAYGFLGVCDEKIVNCNHSKFISIFSGYKVFVKINGENFEDFVSGIESRSHRALIRKERKLFLNSDFRIEILRKLGKDKRRILEIFEHNFSKYGVDDRQKNNLTEEFITALDKNYEGLVFFVERRRGKIVSALMCVQDERRLVAMRVGQVDVNEEKGFPFFNLGVYEPVNYCVKNSKKFLELGTANYKYKIRRGAEISNGYTLLSSTSSLKNLYLKPIIRVLDRRNRRKHANRLDRRKEK